MDEPRDFSLLDDDDEITPSPFFDGGGGINGGNKSATNKNNTSAPASSSEHYMKTIESNATAPINLRQIKVERPKPVHKLNISPNRPNANSGLELKSIDRPRSHSPLKLTGIEEYIQQYEKTAAVEPPQANVNKITMNLKMDDLLANVNKNENSYQMLADFSILTGDPDPLNHDQSSSKYQKKRKSIDAATLGHDNHKNDDEDDDADDDDDDDERENDPGKTGIDKGNLNYKYTAVYRKDEATGAFKEHAKTTFETKADLASAKNINNNRPRLAAGYKDDDEEVSVASEQAKNELANALAALKNNSKLFESKLDKLDNVTFAPSAPAVTNAKTPVDDPTALVVTGEQPTVSRVEPPQIPDIRKNNDSFFNDILSKSDNLLAQTQNKLERLSKLDSVVKPIAHKQAPPPPVKPKPVPSKVVPDSSVDAKNQQSNNATTNTTTTTITITNTPTPAPTPTSLNDSLSNQLAPIGVANSIKDSKSLIDLKSNESAAASTAAEGTNAVEIIPNSQVDLLFDINEQSFTLNTEPLKQGDSYFDLIGLSTIGQAPTNASKPAADFSLPSDLLKLTETDDQTAGKSSSTPSPVSTPFRDQLLDDLIGPMDQPAAKPETTNILNESIMKILASEKSGEKPTQPPLPPLSSGPPAPPAIDILITEPVNERDDNNIVPEGYFNLKHEIPYDQSRPHSPSNMEHTDTQTTATTSVKPMGKDLSDERLSTVVRPNVMRSTSPSRITTISPAIARPRPVSPAAVNRPRPPSPTASRARSRPSSPKIPSPQTIPEDETPPKAPADDFSLLFENKQTQPTRLRKEKKKVKTRVYDSRGSSQGESTSSSDSNDDDEQKIQIKIRPKSSKLDSDGTSATSGDNVKSAFVPLLPRPPRNAQEIEEFRQRRRSSDSASITRSIKEDDDESDSDTEVKVAPKTSAETQVQSERKDSATGSEYNLELPDEDDQAPLADFNDKCELHAYSDGTYGCIVLVRQPFRNPNVLYKNALQKFTEVRTWTEYLVRLVTTGPNEKKLYFYNAHELVTLAAEQETTIDLIIEKYIIDTKKEEVEPEADAPKTTADDKLNANSPPEDDSSKVKKIPPFHEITLKASYKFTDMLLQQYDTYSKIHTFKIQEIVFKETFQMRPDRIMALPERFFKRFTKPKVTSLLDHTPLPFEICKFGHMSYTYLRSFLLLLQDAFWSLPTVTRKLQREQQLAQITQQPLSTTATISAAAASLFSLGSNKQIQNATLSSVTSSHTREEVTVKVVDEYKCKLDKECRIVSHRSRTRIFLITFLNDANPIIEVGLNDCLRHGLEIVGRQDIIPIKTEQWISPEGFELNENVLDREEFDKTHCLRCVQMPDNLLVELMRYRTRPKRNYELPLQVRCFMSMVGRQVEIRIECTVGGTYFTKLNEVYCQDIQIRFPLPDVWVYLFRVEKRFRYGAVHSTKQKLGKIKGFDRLLVHKSANQGAIMEASCGMAKYEQAFKSLVWRIEQLPVKNKDIYKTQLFICKLQLQEYDTMPDKYEDTADMQYSIPICASSKTQVRSISVNPCEESPEKWVKLKSRFEYQIDINYSFDQQELPAVDKERCAELQHLSQAESEGDNNEEEENDD